MTESDQYLHLRGEIMSLVENGNAMSLRMEEIGDSLNRKLDTVLCAFPNEDVEAHRRYHLAIIEREELRNKMINEALIKMAGAGAIAGCGWLAYAIWVYFKFQVTH